MRNRDAQLSLRGNRAECSAVGCLRKGSLQTYAKVPSKQRLHHKLYYVPRTGRVNVCLGTRE